MATWRLRYRRTARFARRSCPRFGQVCGVFALVVLYILPGMAFSYKSVQEPWTLFRLPAGLAGHRVVWPDIALRPSAVALDETDLAAAVPLNTCYVARAADRATALAVALILNTTWARAIALATADEARGGYRRINARVAGQMPVPAGPTRARLAAFGTAAHRKQHAHQDELDAAVADAFGLSTADCDLLRRFAAHHG